MVTIIQTTSSIMNNEEIDFQSRTFKYESFSSLIDDFESDIPIRLDDEYFSSTMCGRLRPYRVFIDKCFIKSSYHAMYRLKRIDEGRETLVRFYVA